MEKGIDFVVKDNLPGLVRGTRVLALFSAAQEARSKVVGVSPAGYDPAPTSFPTAPSAAGLPTAPSCFDRPPGQNDAMGAV